METRNDWPQTYQEAAEPLLRDVTENAKAELRAMTEDELIQAHFGLGMWIRNNYGLWRGRAARPAGFLIMWGWWNRREVNRPVFIMTVRHR